MSRGGLAFALAFALAAGGCAVTVEADDDEGEGRVVADSPAGAASAVFSSERAAYRVAVNAPNACFEAAEDELVEEDGDVVSVTRTLRETGGFCAQVITEVVFDGVAPLDEDTAVLKVRIVNETGSTVRSVAFDRPA
ncbi:MAG: hypothetical protein AAF322_10255 [Pseudomonadota bacterium]